MKVSEYVARSEERLVWYKQMQRTRGIVINCFLKFSAVSGFNAECKRSRCCMILVKPFFRLKVGALE
jgi:hypothetical protein